MLHKHQMIYACKCCRGLPSGLSLRVIQDGNQAVPELELVKFK